MKSKSLIWLSTLLALNAAQANPENIRAQCTEAFYADQFQTVINTCKQHQDNSPEIQFLVKASEVFTEINQDQIYVIFLDARLSGQGKRQLTRGSSWLFNQKEEQSLRKHLTAFHEFEKYPIPDAIFWSAILFYIDEHSLADIDGRTRDKTFNQGRAERKDRLYTMRLETLHSLDPSNPNVNFLLGLEGIRIQLPNRRAMADMKQLKTMLANLPETLYYSVEDPRYYQYMLQAGEMGFEAALQYIDGVNAWEQRLGDLAKQAEQGELNAIIELGDMAYRNGDIDQAIRYFTQAGQAGDVQSLKSLSTIYVREAPDAQRYVNIIKQLVELGDVDALLTLDDYEACMGNTKRAKKLYEKAHKQGQALAQYALLDLQDYGEPTAGCEKFK